MENKFIDLTNDDSPSQNSSTSSNNQFTHSFNNKSQIQEPPRLFSKPMHLPLNRHSNSISPQCTNFNSSYLISNQVQYPNLPQSLPGSYPQLIQSNHQQQQKSRNLPSSLLAPFQQCQSLNPSSMNNTSSYYRNLDNRATLKSFDNFHFSSKSYVPYNQHSNINNRISQNSTTWVPPVQHYYSSRVVFSLINDLEFTARAEFSNSQHQLVNIFKHIPGSKFDWNIKKWIFPTSSHDILSSSLTSIKCHIETIPRAVLSAAQMKVNDKTTLDKKSLDLLESKVPTIFLDVLAPFQKETILFALKKEGRILIADEMGLGKTRSALGVCIAYRFDWPVMIVCPSSARHHWQNEINNLVVPTGLIEPREVTVVDNSTHPLESSSNFKFKFLIISYNLFNKMSHLIEKMNFNVIVADESHYLKNRQAKRTKILVPLIQKSNRAILISGTPALSRPLELYCQLNALKPDSWNDYKAFGKRYCVDLKANNKKGLFNSHNRHSSWGDNIYKGANNTRELHVLLSSSVMIRRLKRNILSQLPAKRRHLVKILVEDNEKRLRFLEMLSQLSIYEELINKKEKLKKSFHALKSSEQSINENDESDDNNIKEIKKQRKNIMLTLFNQSGDAKIPGIIKAIDKFIQNNPNEKILIFAHHLSVLNAIQTFIQNQSIDFIRIDGGTSSADRHKFTQLFQVDPNIKIALLGITAAGIALTLTASSVVFFAEFIWTPGALIQAEDRAHRIGQLRDVNIYYLFASDSVDEILWPFLRKKMKLIGEIVEGQNDVDLNASVFNNVNINNNSTLEITGKTDEKTDILSLDLVNDDGFFDFVNEIAEESDINTENLSIFQNSSTISNIEDDGDEGEEEEDLNQQTQDEDDYEAYLNKEDPPDPLALYYMNNADIKTSNIEKSSRDNIDYFSLISSNQKLNSFPTCNSKAKEPITIDLIENNNSNTIILDLDFDDDKPLLEIKTESQKTFFQNDTSDSCGKRNFSSSSNEKEFSTKFSKNINHEDKYFDCDSFEFNLI